MEKSSLANVQYWHTSIAVLSRKYSSTEGEVLQFGYVQTEFSLCWKYFFALLKIFFQAFEFFWKKRAIWIGAKADHPNTHFAARARPKIKIVYSVKKITDTPPTPGVGRKPTHSLHVTVNYRHLRKFPWILHCSLAYSWPFVFDIKTNHRRVFFWT